MMMKPRCIKVQVSCPGCVYMYCMVPDTSSGLPTAAVVAYKGPCVTKLGLAADNTRAKVIVSNRQTYYMQLTLTTSNLLILAFFCNITHRLHLLRINRSRFRAIHDFP